MSAYTVPVVGATAIQVLAVNGLGASIPSELVP
jgi:hypothetical protein